MNLIIWLTSGGFTIKENKLSQFSRFLLMSGYAFFIKILKWLKLLNSVPFIKNTLVNHVYNQIWSLWLTFCGFTVKGKNYKISQFSRFLLRAGYAILVKIWKSLKLPNSVPFMKKTRVNHVSNRILSSLMTSGGFTVKKDNVQN